MGCGWHVYGGDSIYVWQRQRGPFGTLKFKAELSFNLFCLLAPSVLCAHATSKAGCDPKIRTPFIYPSSVRLLSVASFVCAQWAPSHNRIHLTHFSVPSSLPPSRTCVVLTPQKSKAISKDISVHRIVPAIWYDR